jgi:SAM-dependent methyltransferase
MNNEQDIRARLNALVQIKSSTWLSEDSVRVYQQGSDPKINGSAAINDEMMHLAYKEWCRPGSRVLDVGCGHGITSYALADHGCSLVSVDISQNMLNVLEQNKNGRDIETRQGDAYHLPNRGELFDAIVARHFLAHFHDWPVIIKEMERCLKPGGHIVIHFSSRENTELGELLGDKDCEWSTHSDPKNLNGAPGMFSADSTKTQFETVTATLGLKLLKAQPLHFFYENRLIGHSLGTEAYTSYIAELRQQLLRPEVLQFVLWFERTVVRNFPVGIAYPVMYVIEKPAAASGWSPA